MSTNFYWTPPADHPLRAFGALHVGKRSGGWAFSVQGFDFEGSPALDNEFLPIPGTSLYRRCSGPALPALVIKSWADWKALLRIPGSELTDEYETVELAETFIERVETYLHPVRSRWQGTQPLLNHVTELQKSTRQYGPVDPDRDFLDDEGFSVSMSDFS